MHIPSTYTCLLLIDSVSALSRLCLLSLALISKASISLLDFVMWFFIFLLDNALFIGEDHTVCYLCWSKILVCFFFIVFVTKDKLLISCGFTENMVARKFNLVRLM